MNGLSYEETIELEKNIKIKNEADAVFADFMRSFTLNVSSYNSKRGMFEIWNDSNNAAYIELKDGVFYYRARFLHESYDVTIKPSSLFEYIKGEYRGYGHFKSAVESAKKKSKEAK